MLNYLLIISTQERLGVVSKQKEIYWHRLSAKKKKLQNRQKSNIVHCFDAGAHVDKNVS